MLKTELVAKNPLRALDQTREGGLVPGQMGLVAARAGTGKTAFLIQVALDNIFRGNPVLHVSVGETVSHVKAWYEEIFRDLSDGYELEKAKEVWQEVEDLRLIMTFRVQAFSAEKLEERLDDLVQQGIFEPRVLVVDGFELGDDAAATFQALGEFARKRGLKVWAAARSHREAGPVDRLVKSVEDLFQLIVCLEPQADGISLRLCKSGSGSEDRGGLSLDPRTLLVGSQKQ